MIAAAGGLVMVVCTSSKIPRNYLLCAGNWIWKDLEAFPAQLA
jgi:hypothetical protein